MSLVINLCAGPGGWCEGLRLAGWTGRNVGIEWDADACRTAVAAGHDRVQANIAAFPIGHLAGLVEGLIGSPPCTTFSQAGQGAGRLLLEILATAITRTARGKHVLAETRRDCARVLRAHALADPKMRKWTRAKRSEWAWRQAVTSVLVVQPMRYAVTIKPRWIALEQVPAVAPLWQHMAIMLRELGYNTWTGVLSAEMFGVPQTRKRAILIASLDRVVGCPEPTHQPYRAGRVVDTEPGLFGDPLPAPVSMADALGWGLPDRPAWTVTAGGTDTGGAEVFGNAKCRAQLRDVVLRNGNQANAAVRRLNEPAGTMFFGKRTNAVDWVMQYERQANGGVRDAAAPSLTVTASIDNGNLRFGDGQLSRRVTVQEAGVLQSFRSDYPWRGTKSEQFRQAGDAMPPLLAAAVLHPLIATAVRSAA